MFDGGNALSHLRLSCTPAGLAWRMGCSTVWIHACRRCKISSSPWRACKCALGHGLLGSIPWRSSSDEPSTLPPFRTGGPSSKRPAPQSRRLTVSVLPMSSACPFLDLHPNSLVKHVPDKTSPAMNCYFNALFNYYFYIFLYFFTLCWLNSSCLYILSCVILWAEYVDDNHVIW